MSSEHDPIETLEELIGKKDALNPMKALDKVKGTLMVFMFFTGLLPILLVGYFKVIGPLFLVLGGIVVAAKGLRMLIHRSRRL